MPDPVYLQGGLCGARRHSLRAEPVLPRGHLRLVALKSSPETQGLSFVDREDLVPLSFWEQSSAVMISQLIAVCTHLFKSDL